MEHSTVDHSPFDVDNPSYATCGVGISLRSPAHSDTQTIAHSLLKRVEDFEKLRSYTDDNEVTIRIGEKEIHANKSLLTACSHYFDDIFSHDFIESTSGVIDLSLDSFCQFNSSNVESLIGYITTGLLKITLENAQYLMRAAVYLQIEPVMSECVLFMSRRILFDDALPLYYFCNQLKYTKIDDLFRVIDTNFVPISRTEEFIELSIDDLVKIIKRDSLHVDREEQVFEAVDRWIGVDSGRINHGPRLISCIRFNRISSSFLSRIMEEKLWVMDNSECLQYIIESKCPTASPLCGQSKMFNTSTRVCDNAHRLVFAAAYDGGLDVYYEIGGKPMMNIQIYNPINDTWTRGRIAKQRMFGRSIVADGEKIFLIGCDGNDETAPCPVFDTQTNTWNEIPSMLEARRLPLTHVIDGVIYAVSDQYEDEEGITSVERFHLSPNSTNLVDSNEWSQVREMPEGRRMVQSCVLNGKIYLIESGRDGLAYDPDTNEWALIPPLAEANSYSGIASLNGQIFVVGGYNRHGQSEGELKKFNPENGIWTKLRSMNYARVSPTVVVSCGKLVVIGGEDECGPINHVEIYDPSEDDWKEGTRMHYFKGYTFMCSLPIPAEFPTPHFDFGGEWCINKDID